MFEQQSVRTGASASVDQGLRSYFLRIYNYMASAILLTGLVAYFTAELAVVSIEDGNIILTEIGAVLLNSPVKWLLMFAPLGMALFLGARMNKMSVQGAQLSFWIFSVIMGGGLFSILLVFTGESIARVFFITAGTFGTMSLYGYATKRDLTGIGSFLMMGLIGIILASIVNIFIGSEGLQFAISVIGVLVFVGLTAYDTQRIKSLYYQYAGNSELLSKAAIMGALNLYLDFINLFIMLLQLFGERR